MHPQTILDSIDELPRVQLARKNTPFEEMFHLRAAIADSMGTDLKTVPPLFIKRDDTTGFAFGGNKARHMEFLFAHFLDRGIDTLININHYDSNNARLVAAACAKTGIKYHWVAYDMVDAPVMGNMLIAHLTGAIIHRVPDQPTAKSLAEDLLAQELANGRNATVVSENPFFDIAGMIGFLETGAELDTQISSLSLSEGDTGAKRTQGMPDLGNSPIHLWGLCGRSIAGIRLYARNTGKPWTATAVAQPHSTTTRKLPRNLPQPLKPSSKTPKPRHLPRTRRHRHPNRLHHHLRRPHPSRHRSHAPSSQNRRHHPRPNLYRKIDVRPPSRNPQRQHKPRNAHNLHPLRRPTPNLRLR